jgi:hypothetical protein
MIWRFFLSASELGIVVQRVVRFPPRPKGTRGKRMLRMNDDAGEMVTMREDAMRAKKMGALLYAKECVRQT